MGSDHQEGRRDGAVVSSLYIGTYYVLALCWFVLTTAMVASTFFIRHLEKSAQRARLEVVKSAMDERQNISADMHDSIGASLSTLLVHFSSETMNLTDINAGSAKSSWNCVFWSTAPSRSTATSISSSPTLGSPFAQRRPARTALG